jgi:serpin B
MRINAWVADKTEQRIRDMLAPGSVDTLTRLILVNAVYFNAAWQRKFTAGATASDTFTKLDGSTTRVDMMNQEALFPYTEGADYQAAALPYDGGELEMLIVLPAAGRFEQFERSLGADALKSMLAALRSENVRLGLPKFRIEGSFSLSAAMQRLGMRAAFTPAADFSGISATESLLIKDIVHKSYVGVDENGTEAAAATAVIVGTTSVPASPKILKLNRPFLFAIVDKATGAIVFWGRVVDPRG